MIDENSILSLNKSLKFCLLWSSGCNCRQ